MTAFATYRNGAGGLEARIKAAVVHFRQTHAELPAGIVVHLSEVAEARAVDKDGLAVRGSGGCLVPEVWLEVPDGSNGRMA